MELWASGLLDLERSPHLTYWIKKERPLPPSPCQAPLSSSSRLPTKCRNTSKVLSSPLRQKGKESDKKSILQVFNSKVLDAHLFFLPSLLQSFHASFLPSFHPLPHSLQQDNSYIPYVSYLYHVAVVQASNICYGSSFLRGKK